MSYLVPCRGSEQQSRAKRGTFPALSYRGYFKNRITLLTTTSVMLKGNGESSFATKYPKIVGIDFMNDVRS